jgi:hypothetical protein
MICKYITILQGGRHTIAACLRRLNCAAIAESACHVDNTCAAQQRVQQCGVQLEAVALQLTLLQLT